MRWWTYIAIFMSFITGMIKVKSGWDKLDWYFDIPLTVCAFMFYYWISGFDLEGKEA